MKKLLLPAMLLIATLSFADHYKLATSIDKNTPTYNSLLNLQKEAFKRAGNHTVELFSLPAERALVTANSGEFDGDASRAKGAAKSYPNLIEIPTPIAKIDLCVYTLNPNIKSITPENAKDLSVIYVRGTKQAEAVLKMFNQDKLNPTSSIDSSLKMLVAGRADILLQVGRIMDEEIKSTNTVGIIKLPKPLFETTVHLILNKKNAALIPLLDKAYQEMEADGSLEKIMSAK